MFETLITLIIGLAVLVGIYLVVKWLLGYLALPAPVPTIIDIIFAVVALIMLLRWVSTIV